MENEIEELKKKIDNLERDRSYLLERVCCLEDKIKAQDGTLNYLANDYRYRMESYSETFRKLNELTLPAIRNMVENDRLKIGEYIYGKY